MRDYVAPLAEMRFTLNELLGLRRLYSLPAYAGVEPGLTDTILDEAGKFAANVYSPLNQTGDAQGVRLTETGVLSADGFAAAYQQFVENGWLTLAQDPIYGGQGLPFTVHMAVSEMWHSACTSLALCSLLTAGGIEALSAHASEALKQLYLPKLVSGEWTATMNLTEPHAGSDLSTLKTRAEPVGDHY
ncbi:MAG: acyl-CoA dehydrogenase family protein, partial [Gammaproteobacteria bacterium]|nr:acyl-CoA dehydrogenase family protein [Gammaproteobacteria bacterium]